MKADLTSDLDQLRAALSTAAGPRDEALSRRLAKVVVPARSLFLGAVLCATFGTFLATLPAVGAGFIAYQLVPPSGTGADPLPVYVGGGVLLLGVLYAWWRFFRWAGRRRSAARELIRHGQFVEARVQKLHQVTGAKQERGTSVLVQFPADQRTLNASLWLSEVVSAVGHDGAFPLLCRPGYEYCLGFPLAGRAVRGHIK